MQVPSIETVVRDYVTDGVPASGKHKPKKADWRRWGKWLEGIVTAFTSNGGLIYSSLAALNADLSKPANSMAWVMGDPIAANNGVYGKVGASGAGSWTRRADLPFSFIIASDVGAGSPNAIQATTSIPVSGSALVWMNVARDNTGSPVNVSFNGGAPLIIKSNGGNDIVPGGLVSGMIVLGIASGSQFRLLSDQASAALVAAVEALVFEARQYRDEAIEAAAGVNLPPVSPNSMLVDDPTGTVRESKTFDEVLDLLDPADRIEFGIPLIPVDAMPDYVPLADTQTLYAGRVFDGGDGKHRHFGDYKRTTRGTRHLFYRRADTHGTVSPGAICYRRRRRGRAWEPEVVLVPAQAVGLNDQRAIIAGVVPGTDRVVVVYSESPQVPVVPTPGNSMGPAYMKAFSFDDDGDAFYAPGFAGLVMGPETIIHQTPYSNFQPFGTLKFKELNGETVGYFSYFIQSSDFNTANAFRVEVMETRDDGTDWTPAAEFIFGSLTPTYNETAVVRLSRDISFAIARANNGGLGWFRRTVQGGAWTLLGTLPGTDDQDVAPSIDLVYVNGRPNFVIGSCDRAGAGGITKFRVAEVDDVYSSPDLFINVQEASADDMGNASGYQHTIVYPNGDIEYVEFREFVAPETATDIRIVHKRVVDWVDGYFSYTPIARGRTNAGSPAPAVANGARVKKYGKMCHYHGRGAFTSKGGATGVYELSLPYPAKNLQEARAAVSIGYMTGISLATTDKGIKANCLQGQAWMEFYKDVESGAPTNLLIDSSQVGAAHTISFNLWYEVA